MLWLSRKKDVCMATPMQPTLPSNNRWRNCRTSDMRRLYIEYGPENVRETLTGLRIGYMRMLIIEVTRLRLI